MIRLTESAKQFYPKCSKYEEQQEEEKTKVANLRESLHHCVQQGSDTLGHLEQLEDPGNPEHSHHPNDGRVDGEYLTLDLLQSYANDRQEDN